MNRLLTQRRRALYLALAAVAAGMALIAPADADQRAADDVKKPSVTLRATPSLGFAPLKVRMAADIRGGPNDYEDFYCASVEWDWADGTTSESSEDCAPYEAGTSTIQRRFSAEHTFQQGGQYDVAFRLKQNKKVVGFGRTVVRVRTGIDADF
jgi:hypothetical protein